MDQEDPKVIKELINLIKKAGGIEELEKQLNLNPDEDSPTTKSSKVLTTPPSAISKSLYQKVLSRATAFKGKTNFNGASSPLTTSLKDKTEKVEKSEKPALKATANTRNSRPAPQNAGLENDQEFEGILREKPKYQTISRARPKPTSPSTDDYNEAQASSDGTSEEDPEEKPAGNRYSQYTSIQRQRPQAVVNDVEDTAQDDDNEEEEIATVTATTREQFQAKVTPQYVSFSRSRAPQETTTAIPATEIPTVASSPQRYLFEDLCYILNRFSILLTMKYCDKTDF